MRAGGDNPDLETEPKMNRTGRVPLSHRNQETAGNSHSQGQKAGVQSKGWRQVNSRELIHEYVLESEHESQGNTAKSERSKAV